MANKISGQPFHCLSRKQVDDNQSKLKRKSDFLGVEYELIKDEGFERLFFVEDHLFEKIKYFQQQILVESKPSTITYDTMGTRQIQAFPIQHILLPYQETIALETLDNIDEFYQKAKEGNYTLIVKDGEELPQYLSIQDISHDKFKQLQKKAKSKELQVYALSPTKYGGCSELVKKGLLFMDETEDETENEIDDPEKLSYFLNKDVQFLEGGLRKAPPSDLPLLKREIGDGNYYLDLIVHTDGSIKGQGHSSLRLTSASGEVFSFGRVTWGREKKNFISSPDPFTFIPKFKERVKRYVLTDKQAFKDVLAFIQQEAKLSEEEPSMYNRYTQNCSHFCSKIIQHVKDKKLIKSESSLTTAEKISTVVKLFFIKLALFFMKVAQYASWGKKKDPAHKIDFSKVQVPLQLLW